MRNTRKVDEAEQWLKDNDPQYEQSKRQWRPPRTDVLERLNDRPDLHVHLDDMGSDDIDYAVIEARKVRIPGAHGIPAVVGDGNYYRRPAKTSDENS